MEAESLKNSHLMLITTVFVSVLESGFIVCRYAPLLLRESLP